MTEHATEQVQRERELRVTPEAAWAAVSDPGGLTGWLAEEVELDPRPGGEARFLVDGERREGWVEEVTPPGPDRSGALVFWWSNGLAPASRVAIELAPCSVGTRVRVVETRPLQVLDLVGIPLRARISGSGSGSRGPALVAA